MNNSKGFSAFQIGVFVTCVIGAVLGLLIFSGKIPVGDSSTTQDLKGRLVIWEHFRVIPFGR